MRLRSKTFAQYFFFLIFAPVRRHPLFYDMLRFCCMTNYTLTFVYIVSFFLKCVIGRYSGHDTLHCNKTAHYLGYFGILFTGILLQRRHGCVTIELIILIQSDSQIE